MRISVIGCGNMGGAIASALADSEWEVSVYDKAREKAEALQEAKGIAVLDSLEEASGSGAIIIAVKPQVLPSLYESLKEVETGLWISIAAGVPLSVLEDHIGTENVVRVYAEAETMEQVEKLSLEVKRIVYDYAKGVGERP